jgi:hypothetical protein
LKLQKVVEGTEKILLEEIRKRIITNWVITFILFYNSAMIFNSYFFKINCLTHKFVNANSKNNFRIYVWGVKSQKRCDWQPNFKCSWIYNDGVSTT